MMNNKIFDNNEMLQGIWEKHFNGEDIPECNLKEWDHLFFEEDGTWRGKPEKWDDFANITTRYEIVVNECLMHLIFALMDEWMEPDIQCILSGEFMDLHFWDYYGIEKPRNHAHEWESELCFDNIRFHLHK